MKTIFAVAGYCASVTTAVALAAVSAMRPPYPEVQASGNAQQGAAYLDCARISASLREPDLVTVCSMFADAPPAEPRGDGAPQPQPGTGPREDAVTRSTSRAPIDVKELPAR